MASRKRTSSQDVLEADIKGGIGVRGESVATFASDIARSVVVIANSILDLHQQHPVSIFLYTLSLLVEGWNQRTCRFKTWPSPLCPLMVAVTTTSWSFATKLRMQRSLLADSAPGCAWMSNLRAKLRGSNASSSNRTRKLVRDSISFFLWPGSRSELGSPAGAFCFLLTTRVRRQEAQQLS